MNKINLEEQISKIKNPWMPVELALLNGQVVRLAMCQGEFHWHRHTNEDELFLVVKGELTIQFKEREDVVLSAGEMLNIPRGVEHCPKCIEPAYVLTFEPSATKSQGD